MTLAVKALAWGELTRSVIHSRGLRARVCKQLGGEVKETEKCFELLMGAFLQCSAVSAASLSNRKFPPSFTVLLFANVHKFWPFGSDFYVMWYFGGKG